MSVAWVGAGIAAVGTISSMSASNKAGKAADKANQISADQAALSREQWERWRQMYEPLEDEFVSESRGLGSVANQNKNAQQAGADVASGFSKVRKQLDEVPVNSADARLREENRINLAEAATSAAAQSQARDSTRNAGRAGMLDAISLGRNLPANATTGMAQAAGGLQAAARWNQGVADNTMGAVGGMARDFVGSKAFKDWMAEKSAPDTYGAWQSSPMADTIYSNGSLGD